MAGKFYLYNLIKFNALITFYNIQECRKLLQYIHIWVDQSTLQKKKKSQKKLNFRFFTCLILTWTCSKIDLFDMN